MLVTGELWPSNRDLKDEEGASVPGETQMENVEHLGQYVYEMTNSKVQQVCSNHSKILSNLPKPGDPLIPNLSPLLNDH